MTRTLRILAALAVLLLSGTVLQAQDTAKQESRRDALRKEIAQLEQQLKENASKSTARCRTPSPPGRQPPSGCASGSPPWRATTGN